MRLLTTWPGRVALWVVFLAVHVWLAFLCWDAPLQPFNDVTQIYREWVEDGLRNHEWVGFQVAFVYPPLALLPMVLAGLLGTSVPVYGWSWLVLVTLLDAVAVLVLTLRGDGATRRRGTVAAWWWLGFLVALGPVALGRLEAVTAPLAIIGVRLLLDRPAVASGLLAAAAWIKIWPGALLAAAVVALRGRRVAMILSALGVTAAVVAVDVVLGGGKELLSFLSGKEDRGLQVESLLAGPWLVAAALGVPGVEVIWNKGINTFEIGGPGTEVAGALSTPLLAVLGLGVLALGLFAALRRRRPPLDVLVPLGVAMVAVFVVTNKVGSPQFSAWAAAPIVLAILAAGDDEWGRHRAWRPAVYGLVLAFLTQLVYPYWYNDVLAAWLPVVLVLELKNLVWVVLLVWGVIRLLQVARRGAAADEDAVLDGLHP